MTLFDVLNPEESLQTIDLVWDIFDKRRRVPEHEREQFKNMPVRLILADWHSIYDACRDEKWFQPYLKKLSTIITVGRELNVCLLIDTQSFNLDALGLAKDTNIRHNLNILSQGFTWIDQDGQSQGDYGVLENIIKNPHVIHESGLREHLREQLRALKTQSQRFSLPIIFTTIEPPRLAILPDIRHYKPGQQTQVKLEGYSPEQLNRILSLEFDLKALPPSQQSEPPSEPLNQPTDEDCSQNLNQFTPLNLTREQVLELIKQLRTELNQTQIIEHLWQVRKGGSADWKQAHAQFKELTSEDS